MEGLHTEEHDHDNSLYWFVYDVPLEEGGQI